MKISTLVILFVLLALPARATPIQYTLQDVVLQDGGTATGGFTFDNTLGFSGFSAVNIVFSGYDGPFRVPTTIFTTINSDLETNISSIEGSPSTLDGCYSDDVSPSNSCYVFSGFNMSLMEPLEVASSIPVTGQFRIDCYTWQCPKSQLGFPFYDNITSGYICTTTPCPGGPTVSVPEPSSLQSILIGLASLLLYGVECILRKFGRSII